MKNTPLAFIFVAPALLFLLAVLGWPLVQAIVLSFQNVGVIGSQGRFVGLSNYIAILGGAGFWMALGRSIIWVIANALLQTLLALGTALILNQKFPGVRVARTWIILTWIVPTVVVVIIWRWLLSSSGGMINPLLMQAGIVDRPVGFFATREGAMTTLVMINSWRWFPFTALMMLAGLTRIPGDLYEAARIDGASAMKRFHPHHLAASAANPARARRGRNAPLLQRVRRDLAAHRGRSVAGNPDPAGADL